MRTIRAGVCNYELNGGGDHAGWLAMHQRLAALDLTILSRLEVNGYDLLGKGRDLFNESQNLLGLAGELGPEAGTALYYDREVFEPLSVWDTAGWPGWLMLPTVLTLRVRGTEDIDFVAAAAHLSYNDPLARASQANDLTRLADRTVARWTTPDGKHAQRKLPVLCIGADLNSYPDPAGHIEGEPPVPRLEQIKDPEHQVHRSYEIAPGHRVMDSLPHRTLTTASLADAARYAALLPDGPGSAAVAPTVDASDTHGPAHRVDFLLTTDWLLPAVLDVEVIDMKGFSDHHTVVATYDLDALIDVYAARFAQAA
ncbi:hypothetical protein [Streptomyces acidiscabies]|uniref:hypothetical protein n=1 Tax=Streptomyces acidiscabies TaxID=42234 RepID=UPI00096569A4|nr:hypothetical protein [Streptomyces acidiscabies]GAV38293.1 hypothetical protein Saa2_01172 [Streptomyces acidiscabies]